jgi:hypothetical protein
MKLTILVIVLTFFRSGTVIGQLRFLGIKCGERFAGGFRGSISLILYRHTKNVSNSMFLVQ